MFQLTQFDPKNLDQSLMIYQVPRFGTTVVLTEPPKVVAVCRFSQYEDVMARVEEYNRNVDNAFRLYISVGGAHFINDINAV